MGKEPFLQNINVHFWVKATSDLTGIGCRIFWVPKMFLQCFHSIQGGDTGPIQGSNYLISGKSKKLAVLTKRVVFRNCFIDCIFEPKD